MADVQRARRPKSPRGPAAIREAERDAEALRMRAQGVPLRDIAAHFELSHHELAGRMIDRAMARVPRCDANKLRHLWDDRHEQAARRLLEVLSEDHYAVSNGRVVMREDATLGTTPVLDRMPNVAAAKALMDVGKRAAALNGLDAPTRKSVEVVTQSAVEREIARLEAELGANDRSERGVDTSAS